MFLILERLDLVDLLNVAEVNKDFSVLASSVFRTKFSHLYVKVLDRFTIPKKPSLVGRLFEGLGVLDKKEEEKKITYIYVSDTYIHLDEYYNIVSIFKHFGHVIKKLQLFRNPLNEYSKEEFLGNLISKYTSDALVDVKIENGNEKVLTYITKPLVSVATVKFVKGSLDTVPTGLSLSNLFPAVRRLNFEYLKGTGLSYFNCHTPHLEQVSIKGMTADTESTFIDLIRNNSQIRDIKIFDDNYEFVNNVNALLPQLETLTLSNLNIQSELTENIRFENVTKFSIKKGNGSPNKLHFPKLQSLHIDYNSERLLAWIDFLREHEHLCQLNLTHGDINDSQFKQLTAHLPGLVEMTQTRGFQSHLSNSATVEYLRSHQNVKKFNAINFDIYYVADLEAQLQHEWHIKIVGYTRHFTRR